MDREDNNTEISQIESKRMKKRQKNMLVKGRHDFSTKKNKSSSSPY